MNSDFMRRLAPHVANLLPVIEGETFWDYCTRVRSEPIYGKRALIAACFGAVSDEYKSERQFKKAVWIATARLKFSPPDRRQPCVICGKYEGLTEAHHVVPLGVQFDAGAIEPIQDFDWLCPTHHAAQHVFIADLLAKVTKSIPGLPPEESDALHRIGVKFVDLLIKLPNWEAVRR